MLTYMHVILQMVEEAVAKMLMPNETPLPLDADHWNMCRFLTSSSLNYRTVVDCIAEVFDTLSGTHIQGCTAPACSFSRNCN